MSLLFAACLALTADPKSGEGEQPKPLFEDGDLIVMLGGTLVERAQEYGHWEAAIQLAHPEKTLRFRNFGWSGDTVWAESRGQFDPPEAGYKRMIEQVTALKPDVIILGYGNAEAFNGPNGLEAFAEQYQKLIEDLPKAQLVFLVPSKPFPRGKQHLEDYARSVDLYSSKIKQLSAENDGVFIAPWGPPDLKDAASFESNGLHLTDSGYRKSAEMFETAARHFGRSKQTEPFFYNVSRSADAEPLYAAIRRKNRLVFDRWRPQNVTYLFGFRKHEQGQNAAEIPQFDPLIDAADAEIDRIKRELAGTSKGSAESSKDSKEGEQP